MWNTCNWPEPGFFWNQIWPTYFWNIPVRYPQVFEWNEFCFTNAWPKGPGIPRVSLDKSSRICFELSSLLGQYVFNQTVLCQLKKIHQQDTFSFSQKNIGNFWQKFPRFLNPLPFSYKRPPLIIQNKTGKRYLKKNQRDFGKRRPCGDFILWLYHSTFIRCVS